MLSTRFDPSTRGLTDDHESDLWLRCAGASPSAYEPTKSESVAETARSTGIAVPTIYSWRHQWQQEGQLVPASGKAPQQWSAADKLAAVIQAAALSGTDLGAFYRQRGLFPKQLARWHQITEDATGPIAPSMADQRELQRKNQELIRNNRQLERELLNKEKATTEAATLL
jgi:transposase